MDNDKTITEMVKAIKGNADTERVKHLMQAAIAGEVAEAAGNAIKRAAKTLVEDKHSEMWDTLREAATPEVLVEEYVNNLMKNNARLTDPNSVLDAVAQRIANKVEYDKAYAQAQAVVMSASTTPMTRRSSMTINQNC